MSPVLLAEPPFPTAATPSICALGEGELAGDATLMSTPVTLCPAPTEIITGAATDEGAGTGVGAGFAAVGVPDEGAGAGVVDEPPPPQLASTRHAAMNSVKRRSVEFLRNGFVRDACIRDPRGGWPCKTYESS